MNGTYAYAGAVALVPGLYGVEQTPFVVERRDARGLDAFLSQFTSWLVLPAVPASPPSRLPALVQRVRALTGWSTRDLAEIIGTSHTTVRMFETSGRVTSRSRDAASRVRPLLSVLVRLVRIAGSPAALALALETSADAGERAVDLLAAGDWAKGFVVATDVINGPRPDMLAPSDDWPALPGTRELS